MVSFNTNGKFTIKQGQGITQGIQEELRLSDAECQQLGSIWNDIINEIRSEGNVKVDHNHNEKPNEGNNFKVYENAIIEFSPSSWSNIVGWVNRKLGKNIGVESPTTETKTETNPTNQSLEYAKSAMKLINQNLKNLQLPQGMNAEQFIKNLKEAYEEQIADLPPETTVADMAQSILTTAFQRGKRLNDTEKTNMQKIALKNAAKLAPNDSIWGIKCSEILNNEESAFNKLFETQTPASPVLDDNNSSDFDTTVNQAKEAILQNIDNLELDDEDKNKIKVFLQQFSSDQVPPEAKNDSVSLSEAAFKLISQAVMPGKVTVIVSQLINNDNRFEDVEINDPSAHPSIQGKKISEIADATLNNTPDKIQNMYNQAQERLRQYLSSNPDREFSSPYDSNKKIKASELLQYINNIKYESSDYGAAQAYDFTPDDGADERNGILINTNKFCSNPNLSEADAIKILIHESLHCAFSKELFAFNNQQEEMFCERQAIRLTSDITNANGSEITDIQSTYGNTYSEFNNMNDTELTAFLENNFINKGYEHRPKNTNGDVNINGYEVMHGDAVFLNGKQIGTIGTENGRMTKESCIMDQLDPNNINIMIPNGAGRVVFADTQPEGALPLEIKRGNDRVLIAFFIPMQPN